MKTRNISIFLFILIFSGVALLGYTQAGAQCPAACTPGQISANDCIDPYGYAIHVKALPDSAPVFCPDYPGELCYAYRYEACSPHIDCPSKPKSLQIPTWNYFVFELDERLIPIFGGSIPSGAKLVLSGNAIGPKCTNVVAPSGKYLLKLNPSMNCQDTSIEPIVIFFKARLPVSPVRAWVVTASDCEDDNMIKAPSCVNYEVDPDRTFCGGRIEVTYDECSAEATSVTIDGCTALADTEAYLCLDEAGGLNCNPLQTCGSGQGGCYVCTDPPVYIDGGVAYFYQSCEE